MGTEVANLDKKQGTHAPNGWGGAREGGGRPRHSRDKIKVMDFFDTEERDRLVMEAKLLAFGDGESKPDKDMIKFLFEQLFGKAKQTQIYEDEEGNKMTALMVKFLDNDGNTATSNGDTNRVSETV